MARADKGMGNVSPGQHGAKHAGPEAEELTETDLAEDKTGNNQLQGNDQGNVHNQRHAQPDTKTDTDGVVESYEKLDKDVRAKRDLGKGNMGGEPHQKGGPHG
jgi:hypothetical protein